MKKAKIRRRSFKSFQVEYKGGKKIFKLVNTIERREGREWVYSHYNTVAELPITRKNALWLVREILGVLK